MNVFTAKAQSGQNAVVLEDMLLTKDLPTAAGSKMLDGYKSLFDAQVVTALQNGGYTVAGKANVGEMGLDLLGETSFYGACTDQKGNLSTAAAQIVKIGEAKAALCFDVNGAPRRGAAVAGLTYVKPTYGTVSRFGTIPAACSGETVGVLAADAATCRALLSTIAGHDDKDGTSLPQNRCDALKADAPRAKVQKIGLCTAFLADVDEAVKAKVDAFVAAAEEKGIEVVEVADDRLLLAQPAWNILMSAEVCNNVSRYEGVKYGYRTKNYKTIDELYTGSRTEAFGYLLKSTILFGSDTLSTENYSKVYDKALRMRRVLCEATAKLLAECDALLLPVCSKAAYAPAAATDPYTTYGETRFTAPACITGLPTVVSRGVQLVGKAFSENALLDLAELLEKEGK